MVTIVIIAGLKTPGYNHITDTISSLCDQQSTNPELMTVGFFIFGTLMIGFAYGLYLRLRPDSKARRIWISLTLYGVGMIFAGIFHDSPGIGIATINAEGVLHNSSTLIAFFSLLVAVWTFAKIVHGKPSWFGFTWFSIAAAAVSLVLSIAFILQSYIPFSGLLQRIVYTIPLIWIEVVSILLFRLSFISSKSS